LLLQNHILLLLFALEKGAKLIQLLPEFVTAKPYSVASFCFDEMKLLKLSFALYKEQLYQGNLS